ncbi:NUDIX domain-containing protein [Anaerolineales bacterium]
MDIRLAVSALIIRDGAVLLVAFEDAASGFHYNFPGGGVEAGEGLREALKREVLEETSCEAEVLTPVLIWEYVPEKYQQRYGSKHQMRVLFQTRLIGEPQMPLIPDENQVGLDWIPLAELERSPLIPQIGAALLAALKQPPNYNFLCEFE